MWKNHSLISLIIKYTDNIFLSINPQILSLLRMVFGMYDLGAALSWVNVPCGRLLCENNTLVYY